jgi:hypothetical protein
MSPHTRLKVAISPASADALIYDGKEADIVAHY